MPYALLADLIVVVHFAFILFVVGGEALIIVGALLRWRWVRNLAFRVLHLLAIVVVAMEALLGIVCPLTIWEREARIRAGQQVETDISFVGRFVHSALFWEFEPWVFTTIYVTFALAVIATLVFVPPRWRKARAES